MYYLNIIILEMYYSTYKYCKNCSKRVAIKVSHTYVNPAPLDFVIMFAMILMVFFWESKCYMVVTVSSGAAHLDCHRHI